MSDTRKRELARRAAAGDPEAAKARRAAERREGRSPLEVCRRMGHLPAGDYHLALEEGLGERTAYQWREECSACGSEVHRMVYNPGGGAELVRWCSS